MARGNRGGRGSGGRGKSVVAGAGTAAFPSTAGVVTPFRSAGQVAQVEWSAEERHWILPPVNLTFQSPANPTYGPSDPTLVTSRAVWQTPLFDLRADFKASDGYRADAQTIDSRALIVGTFVNLFAEIRGIAGLNPSGGEFQFYSLEFGAVMDPNRQQIMTRENITGSIFQSTAVAFEFNQTIARWRAEGPLRYWGVALVVDQFPIAVPTAVPRLVVAGALH